MSARSAYQANPQPHQFGGGKVDPAEAGKKGMAVRWGKARADIVAICREATPEAVRTLREVLIRPDAKDSDRIRAAEILLSYGHGKPMQGVELKAQVDHQGSDVLRLDRGAVAARLALWVDQNRPAIEGGTTTDE